MQIQLFVGNTMEILLEGLQQEGGGYINDATVAVTISKNGVNVAGETWPFALAYVAASNGSYLAVLSSAIELIKNQRYEILVTATKSGIGDGRWIDYSTARQRSFAE